MDKYNLCHNQISKETLMSDKFIDPVCDMEVTPETAAGKSEYQGQTYYFCSPGCKKSFDKEPEKYMGKAKQPDQH